ncbi:ABC transporter permease [Chloroflexota bacterium]
MTPSEHSNQTSVRIGKVKSVLHSIIRHESAVLIIVLIGVIGMFSAVTKGLTSSRANMLNILEASSIRGVGAVGQSFVMLGGGIDVSIGGVGLASALTGAKLLTSNPFLMAPFISEPVPIAVGLMVMMLVGIGFGTLNGLGASRAGVPALIVTLAMWEIGKGVGFRVSGGYSIPDLPEGMAFLGTGRFFGVPMLIIYFIVVVAISYFVLQHTTYGRNVYASGGNPLSAWLSGVNVKNIQTSVFMISGFMAGLAGVMMTSQVMAASARTLQGLEIDSIASAAVGGISLMGGRGSIIGTLVGVLIIGVINNGMSVMGADPAVQGIVRGVIIFTAVAIDFWRRRR